MSFSFRNKTPLRWVKKKITLFHFGNVETKPQRNSLKAWAPSSAIWHKNLLCAQVWVLQILKTLPQQIHSSRIASTSAVLVLKMSREKTTKGHALRQQPNRLDTITTTSSGKGKICKHMWLPVIILLNFSLSSWTHLQVHEEPPFLTCTPLQCY